LPAVGEAFFAQGAMFTQSKKLLVIGVPSIINVDY
jgi:hypothetical protein